MWRPDGFSARAISDRVLAEYTMEEMYRNKEHIAVLLVEAGADAIIEALFKLAKESPTGTFVFDSRVVNIYNLIPDGATPTNQTT